jgi:hypothetical protein
MGAGVKLVGGVRGVVCAGEEAEEEELEGWRASI